MRRSFIRTLAPLAAITLIAGACSDDDDEGGDGSAPADLSVAPDASAGGDSVATGDTAADTTTADSAGGRRLTPPRPWCSPATRCSTR